VSHRIQRALEPDAGDRAGLDTHYRTFDAWAELGASVAWSDRAVQHYDQWLVYYANASLAEVARSYISAAQVDSIDGSLVVDGPLIDLRNRLGAQVHAWKGRRPPRVC